MKKLTIGVAGLVLVAVTAFLLWPSAGSGGTAVASGPSQIAPSCTEALGHGRSVTPQIETEGCVTPEGILLKPVVLKCKDGSRLVKLDGWVGLVGGAYRRGTDVVDHNTADALMTFECVRFG